jgi:tetratricopeptide (TPR) repeat protein
MKCWRSAVILLLCLGFLAPAAWGGQNLLIKGIEAQKAGKNELAVKLLAEYLHRYPQMAEARRYLALALVGLGRQTEALQQLNMALAERPQDLHLLLAKGKVLAGLERRSEAIGVFTQVIRLDPRNPEAYKERGDNRAQEGDFDAALQDLDQAALLAPKDPWVFNKRGMAYFCQGNYQAAVVDFSTAIGLRPDLPHAYFFRANIYRHHLRDLEQAVNDYEQACKLGFPLACQELEKLGIKPPK